ncbi:MAG TPA: hypothetical protein PK649_08615 [Vicingus sp.]|nr:hypothetical protein [Vicingus sp.]HRP61653.1 hypothetical protein [Vicingus sp.]
MKTIFTLTFLLVGTVCFSQNSNDNIETILNPINNSANKIETSKSQLNNTQLKMVMRDGVIIDPTTNVQYDEQDVIIKEQHLIDKTKNLSEVNPN